MKGLVLLAGAAALGLAGPAIARPGDRHGHASSYGNCPPGLAKKNNGCLPPGRAKKLYRGERYRSGYGTLYSYQRIPYDVRQRYRLTSRYRYYYDNGTIYAVDPRTMLISQVISALIS